MRTFTAAVLLFGWLLGAANACQAQQNLPVIERWSGRYPVAELSRLPNDQMLSGIGFIADSETWHQVWDGVSETSAPDIDFDTQIIVFAHNVRFLNSVHVAAGIVDESGIVDVLAVETKSAQPIEEFVYWSAGTIPRQGLSQLRLPDGTLEVTTVPEPYLPLIVIATALILMGWRRR